MSDPRDIEQFRKRLMYHFRLMTDLLESKRRSYGTTNLIRFGGIGIVIRASDKIDRLANLYRDGGMVSGDGDSRLDAWRDLIGYGVLGLLHEIDTNHDSIDAVVEKQPPEATGKSQPSSSIPPWGGDIGRILDREQ